MPFCLPNPDRSGDRSGDTTVGEQKSSLTLAMKLYQIQCSILSTPTLLEI